MRSHHSGHRSTVPALWLYVCFQYTRRPGEARKRADHGVAHWRDPAEDPLALRLLPVSRHGGTRGALRLLLVSRESVGHGTHAGELQRRMSDFTLGRGRPDGPVVTGACCGHDRGRAGMNFLSDVLGPS